MILLRRYSILHFIASTVLVFFLTSFFLFSHVVLAESSSDATLSFGIPSSTIKEGDKITSTVQVSTGSNSINAVSGTLSFPTDQLRFVSINKNNSIIKLWTHEPALHADTISFEGIILNPGFQGTNGNVFNVTFQAKKSGIVHLHFNEGAILANDGLGTNILGSLTSANFTITSLPVYVDITPVPIVKPTLTQNTKPVMAPVITSYLPAVGPGESVYVAGKGEPLALTKISFQDVSEKSLGEKFIAVLQNKKDSLGNVILKNADNGTFHYLSGADLAAGVYNATPALVSPAHSPEVKGSTVQILVNDSVLVKDMVVFLNVLALLIPILFAIVIIFFIPWYSWRRMRLMREKMKLEEEEIKVEEKKLENEPKP